MTDKGTFESHTKAGAGAKPSDQRSPRSIRFSNAEWQIVEGVACQRDMSPSEFVRRAALDSPESRSALDPVPLPPALVELIKVTYRAAYILSTLKRDEMIREGRAQEMDEVVRAAREAQAFVLSSASPNGAEARTESKPWAK